MDFKKKDMRKISIVGVLVAMVMLPEFVHAQQYTLKQCLDYALESNAKIDKARYDFHEGEEKTREVKAQALPQVGGSASYTDNLIVPSLVIGDQVIKMGAQYNTNIGAEASQQLFNQSVFTGIRAAKVSEEYYNQNL